MNFKIAVEIPNQKSITIELDKKKSPHTVELLQHCLPFKVGIHVWGEEIYTDPTPISIQEENSMSTLQINDVAYWPPGKAICLFFGRTPIGKKDEIKPYSPVNVIGKILSPNKTILSKIKEGTQVTFRGQK